MSNTHPRTRYLSGDGTASASLETVIMKGDHSSDDGASKADEDSKRSEFDEAVQPSKLASLKTSSPERADDGGKAVNLDKTEDRVNSSTSTAGINETSDHEDWPSTKKDPVFSASENDAATSPLSNRFSAGTDDGEETEAAEFISIDNEETDDAVDSSIEDILTDGSESKTSDDREISGKETRLLVNGGTAPCRLDAAGRNSTDTEGTTDEDDTPLRICHTKTDRKRVHSASETRVKLCNGDVATHLTANHHSVISEKTMSEATPAKKKRRSSSGTPTVDSDPIDLANTLSESVCRPSSLEIPDLLPIVKVKEENVEFYQLSTSLSPPLTTTPPGVSPLSVGVEVSRKPKSSGAVVGTANVPVSVASPDPSPSIPPLIHVPEPDPNCLATLDHRAVASEATRLNGNNNGGSCVRSRKKSVTPEFAKEPDVAIIADDVDEDKPEKRTQNGPSSLCQTHQNKPQTTKYSRTALTREKPTTIAIAPVYNHIPSWVRGTMSLLQKVIKFRGNKTKGEPDASAWFLAPVDPLEVPGTELIRFSSLDYEFMRDGWLVGKFSVADLCNIYPKELNR